MRAAVPSAKLTGPSSLLTTIVLPGSYVVTVPDAVVDVVVVSVVAGCVLVVCSVVVVLVCANASGAINAQPIVIMLFFIVCFLCSCVSSLILATRGRRLDTTVPFIV